MNIHNEYTNPIDDKIEILRDFCILKRGAAKQEAAVREILENCENEIQMEQKLHNVLRGKETLKEFIGRHHMSLMRQK